MMLLYFFYFFFFFNDTATTEIYTLSLHDALPISLRGEAAEGRLARVARFRRLRAAGRPAAAARTWGRSEEHTSELQSRPHLVCRLLLEKKKTETAIVNRHKPQGTGDW